MAASAVYVGAKDAQHREWKVGSNRFAIHEPSSAFFGDESQFLDQVLEHIKWWEAQLADQAGQAL
jgi:hypothetical protein